MDNRQWIADNGQTMARGRPWTAAEDDAIRAAARATRDDGLTVPDTAARAARLADVARRLGRTLDATRKRAQRIGAWSYPMFGSGRRRRRGV